MAHGDDNGLVLPPKLAPIQVVMVPIFKSEEELNGILAKMNEIAVSLKAMGISYRIDDRDNLRPGFKFSSGSSRAFPVRIAIGRAIWKTAW